MELLGAVENLTDVLVGLAGAIPPSVEALEVFETKRGLFSFGHTNRIHAGFARVNRTVESGLPVGCRRGIPAGVNRSTLPTCPPPPPARLSGVVAEATTP